MSYLAGFFVKFISNNFYFRSFKRSTGEKRDKKDTSGSHEKNVATATLSSVRELLWWPDMFLISHVVCVPHKMEFSNECEPWLRKEKYSITSTNVEAMFHFVSKQHWLVHGQTKYEWIKGWNYQTMSNYSAKRGSKKPPQSLGCKKSRIWVIAVGHVL